MARLNLYVDSYNSFLQGTMVKPATFNVVVILPNLFHILFHCFPPEHYRMRPVTERAYTCAIYISKQNLTHIQTKSGQNRSAASVTSGLH
ncbi:hypothetical protein J6590_027174 [Homalodisca vitripennis]|nr:hypothetical protein J6590_027174 [Homalodisca vitripennis]